MTHVIKHRASSFQSDNMWSPYEIRGKQALSRSTSLFRSSVPDYSSSVLQEATCTTTDGKSTFIFWRGSGTNRNPLLPSTLPSSKGHVDPSTPFTHYGIERLRMDHEGRITDCFVFSGPTREQASHLLFEPSVPFDDSLWMPIPNLPHGHLENDSSVCPCICPQRKAAMLEGAHCLLGLMAGRLWSIETEGEEAARRHIAPNVKIHQATRLWNAHGMGEVSGLADLVSKSRAMAQIYRSDHGFPLCLSHAFTADGTGLFLHTESVFHNIRSGLRSVAHSMHLLVFEPPPPGPVMGGFVPRVTHCITARGPATDVEKSHHFDVLCTSARAKFKSSSPSKVHVAASKYDDEPNEPNEPVLRFVGDGEDAFTWMEDSPRKQFLKGESSDE
jgi:hypothetical protein